MKHKPLLSWVLIPFLAIIFLVTACSGVKTITREEEPFQSNLKKRVGILPFEDMAGLGTEGLEVKLADMTARALEADETLITVSWHELENYIVENEIQLPLEESDILRIGKGLRLNAMLLGSIAEATQQKKRTEIGNMAPFLIGKKDLATVVLICRAVDAHTGITLTAGTETGETPVSEESQSSVIDNRGHSLNHAALFASLDQAILILAKKMSQELSKSFWDGYALEVNGKRVTMEGGVNIGVVQGDGFEVYSEGEKVTNVVGQTFIIPGAKKATLTAIEILPDKSILEIDHGEVKAGDTIRHIFTPED